MARIAAIIGERLASFGDKLPFICSRMQGQHQDPESTRVTNFTVGLNSPEEVDAPASRPDDKFADSPRGIGPPVGVLAGKAFIVVIVPAEDKGCARLVERFPESSVCAITAMPA